MQSYSPQELERMQKQAIDRVHEMQRQAQMGAAENRRNMGGATLHYAPQGAPEQQKPPKSQPAPSRPAGKDAQKTPPRPPQGEPSEKKAAFSPPLQTEKPPTAPEIKRVPGRKQFAPFLSMDSDTALILPLILLLQKDGADEMLILALLYIMA